MSAASDSGALLDQAMARLGARDFGAAATLFNRAIALGRDAPEIRNNLGQALRFSGLCARCRQSGGVAFARKRRCGG
jgi:Flp pilus assembly protein TadD